MAKIIKITTIKAIIPKIPINPNFPKNPSFTKPPDFNPPIFSAVINI